MSKPSDHPPAYDGPPMQQPAQPSQAHLDPRSHQNQTFSPSPAPYQQNNGNFGPQPGYASPGPQGYYGDGYSRGPHDPYQQQGMYYGPQNPGWQQGPPPQGYYQQGGHYPPQGPYGYPQNTYYERQRDRDTGCCAILMGTLAACCCLDLFLF